VGVKKNVSWLVDKTNKNWRMSVLCLVYKTLREVATAVKLA
jgi:hypothetical protein